MFTVTLVFGGITPMEITKTGYEGSAWEGVEIQQRWRMIGTSRFSRRPGVSLN